MKKIEIFGLESIGEVDEGDDLGQLIADSAGSECGGLQGGDAVVITSKIVTKALGLIYKMDDIEPRAEAVRLGEKVGKDPKLIELMWQRGRKIVAMIPVEGMLRNILLKNAVSEEAGRQVCDREKVMFLTRNERWQFFTHDGGLDRSNFPPGYVGVLPEDPDAEAKKIGERLREITGENVAVILADTEVVTIGTFEAAVGSWGIQPRAQKLGEEDKFGRPKFGGLDLLAHQMAGACGLLFGQTDAWVPAAVMRGAAFEWNEHANVGNSLWLEGVDEDELKQFFKGVLNKTSEVMRPKAKMAVKAATKMM